MASEEIIENINKIRPAFNVSTFAQVAAIAALDDQDFVKQAVENNTLGREYLCKEFDKMGLPYAQSQTNHIWVDVKRMPKKFSSTFRKGSHYSSTRDTFIRVSIGLPKENEYFIQCLKEELGK